MSPEQTAEAFRRAELRLRLVLLGDGMNEPGAVKGEEARLRVTAALRHMREAFTEVLEESRRQPTAVPRVEAAVEPVQHAPSTPEALLSPSEVADEVGLSVDAVYRAVKRNEIAALRRGNSRRGAIRIPASEVVRIRKSRG